jgi:aminoglycoside 6'-N-acetyltransferase I
VESFFTVPERWGLAALESGALAGWIGVIETYDHGWEMHPLVVAPAHQRRGLGARLLRELEARVKARGVLTLYLGTDDDFGGTNLFGRDLFPNVASHIAAIAETQGHPFGFYRKQGYEVVGLFPDVNGFGKPDIFMAKRL